MARYTFRTEGFGDGKRVPLLLKELALSLADNQELKDPVNDDWEMDQFTIVSDLELEALRKQMADKIDEDKRFIDMHRCAQTLALGEEPDEEWFLR